jgi:retinol dehydrogenase-12
MQMVQDKNSINGNVCLVTGATAGIGIVTATVLAAQGAEVIIAGQNEAKTRVVRQQIVEAIGNQAKQYLVADFSNLSHVREMAITYKECYSRLDALVNNAGAFFNTR